jgi:hypothetical protein
MPELVRLFIIELLSIIRYQLYQLFEASKFGEGKEESHGGTSQDHPAQREGIGGPDPLCECAEGHRAQGHEPEGHHALIWDVHKIISSALHQ